MVSLMSLYLSLLLLDIIYKLPLSLKLRGRLLIDSITSIFALLVRGIWIDNRLIEESGINVASQGLISLQRILCEKSLPLTEGVLQVDREIHRSSNDARLRPNERLPCPGSASFRAPNFHIARRTVLQV